MEAQERKKTLEGIIVSARMNKTVTVSVERTISHPRYKKIMKQNKKYYAHHEKNDLKAGQKVQIQRTRPLSKLKRWIVVGVLS